MRDAKVVEREGEERVGTADGAGRGVVLRRHRNDLAHGRLEPAGGRPDHLRVAGDRLDACVVAVLVCHQEEVGGVGLDGRVGEPEPCRDVRWEDTERVDRDRVLAPCERECGLPVPADDHRELLSIMTRTSVS